MWSRVRGPVSSRARFIASTFAWTSLAFDPNLARPTSARDRALAPTVMFSICEDDADSVRSRTADSGANSPSNMAESSASNRVIAARASSALAATSGSMSNCMGSMAAGTAAR